LLYQARRFVYQLTVDKQGEIKSAVIRAAGGVIWRDSPRGREVAVIRRTRHGEEWTLPKGKLQPGESWSEAALREVREETGCEVSLGSLAGCHAYLVDRQPKLVLFWNMELVRAGQPHDSGEVKELRWLTVPDALKYLRHPGEKRILTEIESQAP
jgi:8-oxo-dGTP pyrophosphatase MutT (NUDIX family)